MTRPTVYLAGPISGLGYQGATDWRTHAQQELALFGINGLSPLRAKEYLKHVEGDVGFSETCDEYAQYSPLSTQRGLMDRDRFDALRCDVLLVNLLDAKKPSLGTCMEIAWADSRRTPIVAVMEPGNVHEHAMVNEAIGFRCGTLEEALHVVRSIIG